MYSRDCLAFANQPRTVGPYREIFVKWASKLFKRLQRGLCLTIVSMQTLCLPPCPV